MLLTWSNCNSGAVMCSFTLSHFPTCALSVSLLSSVNFIVIPSQCPFYPHSLSLLSPVRILFILRQCSWYPQSVSLLSPVNVLVIPSQCPCYPQSMSLLSSVSVLFIPSQYIGRASSRERLLISFVAVSLNIKQHFNIRMFNYFMYHSLL